MLWGPIAASNPRPTVVTLDGSTGRLYDERQDRIVNRQEFEHLRDLPGKRVTANIVWTTPRDAKPNRVFELVALENELGCDVVVNGTYKPDIPAVTYNFVLRGVGPICRVDVNGTIHGNAGRTHKHDLRQEADPQKNLPVAVDRKDLDGKTPRQVWEDLCTRANIQHTGNFQDP
jgi:hypothetical protein